MHEISSMLNDTDVLSDMDQLHTDRIENHLIRAEGFFVDPSGIIVNMQDALQDPIEMDVELFHRSMIIE